MLRLILVFGVLLCNLHTNFAEDVDFEGTLNIKLFHSLSNTHEAEYSERGNISVLGGSTHVTNLPLSHKDKMSLLLLAEEDKFYKLKAILVNNDKSETVFLTYIKACMLVQSGLNDFITVSLDHAGNVVAISLGVQSGIACQGAIVPIEKINKFNSKVIINSVAAGSIPDTASYIQKLDREREAKERGEVKDTRSFLGKYWMYIVPVVILMVLSSAANPDAAGGGNGRQG